MASRPRSMRRELLRPARFADNLLSVDGEHFDPASWLCRKADLSTVARALTASQKDTVSAARVDGGSVERAIRARAKREQEGRGKR